MKLKLLKDILGADEKAYLKDSIIEVNDEYAQELIEAKSATEYVIEKKIEIVEPESDETVEEIKSLETEETEEETVEQVEVKSIKEIETMDIEVKETKLSPEKKLINTIKVAKFLKTGVGDAETKAIAGQGETVAADGGALVDNDIVSGIWKNAIEVAQIMPKVQQRPVGRNFNALEIKQLNEANGTPADYNGINLSVYAEGAQIAVAKRAYASASAAVNKLATIIPFTNEILEDDAHGILAATEEDIGKAFGMKLDQEILYGTDSLLTASVGDAGSVAVTLVDASAPTAAELRDLYIAQINPAQAEWYMSGAVYENLMGIESTNGQQLIQPNYNVSPFGTLFGRPVNVVSCMLGANGEAGTIGFCDWRDGYIMGTKGGVKMASSMHVYFDVDQEAIRWVLRVAGLPKKASTMTLADAREVAPLVFGNDS